MVVETIPVMTPKDICGTLVRTTLGKQELKAEHNITHCYFI